MKKSKVKKIILTKLNLSDQKMYRNIKQYLHKKLSNYSNSLNLEELNTLTLETEKKYLFGIIKKSSVN